MSWVRYDDGFYSHPKVGAVLHDDPAAIALHVLANTWSCQQKRPGFVPTTQPGILVGSKTKGQRWAALLEQHGLWDRADGGWEFHDHAVYRESGKRTTPGTPADLSEKRAAAGRKGGKAAQQKKQRDEQTPQQTEQVAATSAASAVSPVVEPPYGASTPEPDPVPPTAAVARSEQRGTGAQPVVDAYIRSAIEHGYPEPDRSLKGRVGKQAAAMLGGGASLETLVNAAWNMAASGWHDLAVQLQRDAAAYRGTARPPSNLEQHAALIRELEAQQPRGEIA